MHIRRSFDIRMFGQSLKRIGAALRERHGERPAELRRLMQPRAMAAQSELTYQLQRIALLTRLAIELRAALDQATIVHTILEVISLDSTVGAAAIVLVGANGAIELAISSSGGQTQPMRLQAAQQVLEHGPAGWNWRDSDSVLLRNHTQDLSRTGDGDASPSSGVMTLPLSHGQATFGVLTLSQPLLGHFTSQDLLLFEGVAAQAGVALSAARMNQETRQPDLQHMHSRDPLHIVFDHLPDGLVLIDSTGHILIANDAFCEDVLGILPRAASGRQYAAILQELQQDAQITIESHPAIPALRRARCESDDGWQRWYDIDRYVVASENGAEQVLERWRAIPRQEKQYRELLRDEQLLTMARLAANIVHELGNPLQSVRSCIDLSREDRALAAPTAEYLELAGSELRRMSQILSRLRDLYRLPLNEADHD